ncbi:acyltransferase family protein [Rhodococcus opacus]|nr:acyltransferase [Rhodococcus opacus]
MFRSSLARRKPVTLRQAFDPKLNALNAVRLVMAVGVIFWHSFPLTGHDVGFAPLRQLVADVWVDGFFAVSGFLITSSWVRRPDVRAYVVARLVRILPALYLCLALTAFVVAPVGVWMQGGNGVALLSSFAPVRYVLANAGIWIFERGVGGTPSALPHSGTWNGSLWTLGWEALCYLGVLALGVVGLLTRRWCLPVAFAGAWALLAVTTLASIGGHAENAARFAVMFLAGALIFRFQDSIRYSYPLVIGAFAITAGSMWLPDYRIVGALFWAYAVIGTGVLIKSKRLALRNDVSYGVYIYAFPIQQLLFIGVGALPPLAFALLATLITLPVAALSWFWIEKPALRLKSFAGPRVQRASVERLSTNA